PGLLGGLLMLRLTGNEHQPCDMRQRTPPPRDGTGRTGRQPEGTALPLNSEGPARPGRAGWRAGQSGPRRCCQPPAGTTPHCAACHPIAYTRTIYVHTGVTRLVAKCATSLSPYPELLSFYNTVEDEVIRFSLTQEGMKYKLSFAFPHGSRREDTAEPIL